MAAAALALFVVMMLLAGALRTLIQRHRTGDSGNRRTLSPRGSLGWSALTATDIGYLMVGVGGPLAHWLGLTPVRVLQHPPVQVLGVVLAAAGILGAFGAQMALGASWRIGVDENERTALVTTGPFRWVRNPIFTAILVALLGLTLMVPNLVALIGWGLALTGIQTQVRLIEEPHLHRIHGEPYDRYTATVGRFLPGVGRLRTHRRASTPGRGEI
ncbi:isoprenylcysteine carboxylmethyltransferase family protein [Mycobacteroides abscessus]|nr:isoprenylcysteine carboxylmethyltransferase family protein [Mycobacteroides abscessus]MDY6996628.1 isoprenylcysteine carboxylmethyltransferase family protein [Actinomycetota bacterium]MDM2407617.1 isoprenylcysteine carboxylmethyltransferase family protein [Mycobacteroides abscessus]MDM2417973.1 isoprenylcysteine carboxylmethyltransferase family protein [Mycobacteroides abscessus]MDO3012291.1 isoprenylcysteine carboxylmethyltransferase family protein [Mycobacteroides abscessus subsp. abscessu